ncbi:DMT family transporter [Salinispira pacifica]|nr:DMT family transporter [Salinispira pacifica]
MTADVLLMLLGQLAAAISIFFIKASQLSPGYLAAYRLFFTVIIMSPWFFRDLKKLGAADGENGTIQGCSAVNLLLFLVRRSLFPGIMLGLHFIFWNTGARMTLAANATLFVNMTPVFMPLVIFVLTRERPSLPELLATAVALSGALLLTLGDISLGTDHLLGDIFSFVSMLFMTVYLALSRKNRALPFWYYISGVYFFGGIVAFLGSAVMGHNPMGGRGPVEIIPVMGLSLVSTILGHNLINRAMRSIPSQIVGVGQLSQFIWAGLIAWVVFGELPEPLFYPSMLLIAGGTLLMIYIHSKPRENIQHGRSLP